MGESRGGAGGGGGGGDGLIKLFGKTIPVPELACDVVAKDLEQHSGSSSTESNTQETAPQDSGAADLSPQPEVVDADDPAAADDNDDDDDADGEKEKLKKPDKILPCPRCSSMDTKFCYFNNYNVNQPRHFCKNCQRYWTAGGAMRNVPVGAGRRKNKNAAAVSHFLQRVRAGDPPALASGNGTVLSFGHDQMIHLKEKLVPAGRAGTAADNSPSMGSCSEVSSSRDDQNKSSNRDMDSAQRSANLVQHPSINGGAIWPYSCAPSPAYYAAPGMAIPMYWGCMVPGAWSLPWSPVQSPSSPATIAPSASSGTTSSSLTLGKHPREGDDEGVRGHGNGSGKVWVPKTIRIDNADEVAKSSIWSMLGIKGGDKEEVDTGGHRLSTAMFGPKQSAKPEKHGMIMGSSFLHANPVAHTRSATFQEGS